ncbi:uncharacterized protein LOC143100896 isoform X2 [Alosa pseudoharengus]|uniref:uncharacterized protein LOC143100896 isoform X2 n=1 Tax=Alosa pseudoharengus TaxID=34774 RepID=UPI003F887EAB
MASCNAPEATNDSVHQGVASTTDKENGNDSQQSSQIAQQSVHAQDEGKKDVHTEPEEACEQNENLGKIKLESQQMEEIRKEIARPPCQDWKLQREDLKRRRKPWSDLPATSFPHSSSELSQTGLSPPSECVPISGCSASTPSSCTELEEQQQILNNTCIELEAYKQKFIEREEEYEQKEERNKITEQKHEKLKQEYAAFQARMAFSISTDIQQHSELSENLNDPCRQSELVLKYEELRLKRLPRIITSPQFQSDEARERIASLVKNTYGKAQEDVTAKTDDLEHIFLDDEGKSNTPMMIYRDMKVKIINLQALTLLRRDSSDYMGKIKFLISEEPAMLTRFIAQWYKISCLMCLHNPPLVPSWDTRGTAANPDMKIFPPIGAMDNEMDSS